jgi:hypothetical protein
MENRPPLEKEEYEIQLYGKAVREMSKERKNIIKIISEISSFYSMPIFLVAEYFKDTSEDTIKRMMKTIVDQMVGRKKSILDEQQKLAPTLLEGFMQRQVNSMKKVQFMMEEKICHIPNDVVLPEDKCQILYGHEEASKVQKEMDCVLARFEAVRFLKDSCKNEIESYEALFEGSKKLIDDAEIKLGEIENSRVQLNTISMLKQIKHI